MTKRVINPNDLFVVEIEEIKQLAEKNNLSKVSQLLEETGAKFVKILFKETELGFIFAESELLDANNQVIKDKSFDFHPDDYLSFIEKFENVQHVAGTPNKGGKIRNRRSVVSMDYDVFHDGDVFHMPYNDFISAVKKVANPEYFKNYEVMKEHGIEHIFFSFHYPDDRKTSGNKLYGFYGSLRNVEINPYYRMEFNIWAVDANGTYFYDEDLTLPEDENRNFEIIKNINDMKKSVLYNLNDTGIELNHSRLGSYNFEQFFNNYDFAKTMNFIGNLRNSERSFIVTDEMLSLVKKSFGFDLTVKKGDKFSVDVSSLSEAVKRKYDLSDNVKKLEVSIQSVDNLQGYLNKLGRFLSIATTMVNKDGSSTQGRELLMREFDEIIADVKNKDNIFISRDDKNPEYKYDPSSKADYFAPNSTNLQYEKTYSIDIQLLKKLKNIGLNEKLDKLLALGNKQVLCVLKIDEEYKINGRVNPITHRTNGKIEFKSVQFPELDIYAFNNTTGKGISPEALENISLASIIENVKGAESYLEENSKDDVLPVSDLSFKSATMHSLGLADIVKVLNLNNDLNIVKQPLGNFKTRTEFNLYTVSKIGQDIVLELTEKKLLDEKIKKNKSPKMKP